MEPYYLGCLGVAMATLIMSLRIWLSRTILNGWAESQGYRIVSSRFCWLWRGPYFLRSTAGQSVFKVIVVDNDGERRVGWVRCGGFFLGLFRNNAHVLWQEGSAR